MAKDMRGVELEVGQSVAFAEAGYVGIQVGKIVKITPKMVELDDKRKWDDYGTRRSHNAVLIVEPLGWVQA